MPDTKLQSASYFGPAMITIDLLTQSVPSNCRVWRMFPGHGYKFLSAYFSQGVAFLDIPGFDMPFRILSQSNSFLNRLAGSEKIANLLYEHGADFKHNVDWRKLRPVRNTQGRGILRRSMHNFYEEAQRGDMIVVPGPMSTGLVYVGAVADIKHAGGVAYYRTEYGETPIPARKVNWLNSIAENKLSPSLIASLRHQNPFNLLEKSHFNEVLAVGYTNYEYGEEKGILIYNTRDDYIDKDAAYIGLISQVSAAICHMIDNGQTQRRLSLINAILDQKPIEYYCSQSVDIHSAGFNRFLSSKITPILIASIIGLLTYFSVYSSRDNLAADIAKVTVTNSISGPDEGCSVPVDKGTKMFLDTTPIDEIWRLCKLARDARDRAGVQSGVSVTGPNKQKIAPPQKAKPR